MSISSLTVELVYLKRLIESIHDMDLPAVALYPRIMDATDVETLGRRPNLDDSALEVLRAQEGMALDLLWRCPAPTPRTPAQRNLRWDESYIFLFSRGPSIPRFNLSRPLFPEGDVSI